MHEWMRFVVRGEPGFLPLHSLLQWKDHLLVQTWVPVLTLIIAVAEQVPPLVWVLIYSRVKGESWTLINVY